VQYTIAVEGLSLFARAVRKIDDEAAKELRLVLNDAGAIVVTYAQKRFPRRTGRSVRTVRAKSTRTQIRVTEGGKFAPWVPWLDFGGRVGRKNAVKRPFMRDGRYLYPILYDKSETDKIVTVLEDGLIRVVQNAGLELD